MSEEEKQAPGGKEERFSGVLAASVINNQQGRPRRGRCH